MTNLESQIEPMWVHYHSHVENHPASIEFDRTLLERGPIESLGFLTSIAIELSHQSESGVMEDDDEIDVIEEMTDLLAKHLQENNGALLAGNIQMDNALIYYIYSNDAAQTETSIKSFMEKYEQYDAQLESSEDASWEFLQESLGPNETEQMIIMIEEAHENLTEEGKYPDRQGKVLYLSLFPGEKQAEKFKAYVHKKGGYELEKQSETPEGFLEVQLAKTELLNFNKILENVDYVKTMAKEFKGEFRNIQISSNVVT